MKYLDCDDNIFVLKKLFKLYDGFIDLIYIDPPYNSNRDYGAFSDIWSNVSIAQELEEMKEFDNLKIYNFLEGNRAIFTDSQMSYLIMMAHRLYYMHKLLKNTGSLYLHCDPTMSHYLKILLDIIFGNQNFRNEIVWSYKTGGVDSKRWSKKHDVILFYSKTQKFTFNSQKEKSYTKSKSRKPGLVNYGKGTAEFFKDENGVFNWVNMRDVWEISYINSQSKERTGYPTQKPEALLERIIKASSNEGDIVADFFCGSGTTIIVAEKLNRNWIGIDKSPEAIETTYSRLYP
jgi:adenine specific DNA methylase Mod